MKDAIDTSMNEQSIYLFKTEGSADKVYNLHLRQKDDGWVVDYENARRGKSLRSGTKTDAPVSFEEASDIYQSTLKSKFKDGYTENESGQVFAGTDRAGDVTGFRPQLLNEISEEELIALMKTGEFLIQEKHNGDRRGAKRQGPENIFSNRSGLRVGVSKTIDDAVAFLSTTEFTDFELDGEDMGSHLVVFDILSVNGNDLRHLPFEERANHLRSLEQVTAANPQIGFRVDLPQEIVKEDEIRQFIEEHRARNAEGLVIRHHKSTYEPGRPASGGPALKLKFWKSATVRVLKVAKGKRSIALEIKDGDKWIPIGNCTILANAEIPQPGDLVEVRYLTVNRGGSLYQPIYEGRRTDISEEDAHTGQLIYTDA